MKLTEGGLFEAVLSDDMWTAGIDVNDHYSAIECHAPTREQAVALRRDTLNGLRLVLAMRDVHAKTTVVISTPDNTAGEFYTSALRANYVTQLHAEIGSLKAELAQRPTKDAYDAACKALWKLRDSLVAEKGKE